MDIYCQKCGEPYEYYDNFADAMTPGEARRFKAGQGCPACHFGAACPRCDGTGKDTGYDSRPKCETCHEARALTIKHIPGHPRYDRWTFGYEPHVEPWTHGDPTPSHPLYLRPSENYTCRDGRVVAVRVRCPDCLDTAEPCPDCHGSGKLSRAQNPRAELTAALAGILGDDLDGLAAELEDAEYLGLI